MEISVKLLRVYTKCSLGLKHICAGGGNVTFVVLRTFLVTLEHDVTRVVMTSH